MKIACSLPRLMSAQPGRVSGYGPDLKVEMAMYIGKETLGR